MILWVDWDNRIEGKKKQHDFSYILWLSLSHKETTIVDLKNGVNAMNKTSLEVMWLWMTHKLTHVSLKVDEHVHNSP